MQFITRPMLSEQNNIFNGGLSPIWFQVSLPSDWDLHVCGCTTMCEYVCELGCLWRELCIYAACVSVYPRDACQCVSMCVCGCVSTCVCMCACVYCLAVYGFVRPYGVLSGECTTHLALLLALVFAPSVPPPSSLSHPLYFSFFFFFCSTFLPVPLYFFDWPTFYFFLCYFSSFQKKLYWPSNRNIYTMATL